MTRYARRRLRATPFDTPEAERRDAPDWPGTGADLSRRRHRPRAGFTLVEVLIALLLIAIILPAVMQGISLATTAGAVAKRRGEAGALAESKLAELSTANAWQTAATSGDFLDQGERWRDYRWSADVVNWTQPEVQELRVTVTWPGRGGADESLTLSTLVYVSGTGTTGGTGTGTASGTGTGTSGGQP